MTRFINSMLQAEFQSNKWEDVLSITREISPKWFILRLTYMDEHITDYIYLDETHRNDDLKLLQKYLDSL